MSVFDDCGVGDLVCLSKKGPYKVVWVLATSPYVGGRRGILLERPGATRRVTVDAEKADRVSGWPLRRRIRKGDRVRLDAYSGTEPMGTVASRHGMDVHVIWDPQATAKYNLAQSKGTPTWILKRVEEFRGRYYTVEDGE